jgi:hypothetical protein
MSRQQVWGISIRVRSVLSFLILPAVCFGFAQNTPQKETKRHWENICDIATAKPLTAIHPDGPLAGDRLKNCDEIALYYGLGEKPNYPAALQCGWYQRSHPQDTNGNMFYGPGVLTMLYAKGEGVARDYDLAIRFACENGWAAEAEMTGRIAHLEQLRDSSAHAPFDLCDDITSGLSDGYCTSIQTRTADNLRTKKLKEIVSRLPLSAKISFPSLQAAESAFEEARVSGEVDLTGTSRGAFQLREEEKLRDQFLINLQRFGRGDIPAASEGDLSRLDENLNDIYRQIQRSPASKWEFGTIKPESIRDTERKWVLLADKWESFARLAYPNLSTTRVRTQLIRLRLHQLRSLMTID